MATRYGYEIFKWLIEHGWKECPTEEDVIGDQDVLDPITNNRYDVYKALEIHKERTDESPVRTR